MALRAARRSGSKNPPDQRPERPAPVPWRLWRQSARQPRPETARARDPAHSLPSRTAPPAPGQAPRRQGYDYDHLRRWLRKRGVRHRIARKCIESSARLGRHRWVVERTVSWLPGCRRLHRRYACKAEHFLAFAGIAAVLICHRRLIASG
ncbi:IS1647-like transposase [Streptomyces sparsogenes DSM 40356]|uniref:IS1647-like transposase n=1 Tax=Streptomyces sparsogenes DSM 40356 TaxID=1331668 RepID=A0A1R1SBM5_9ACTN|nr:IS1647-like transposase [Streptomyces sparsogenes DSM 40356]